MTFKQFVIAVAVGAALAVIVKKSTGTTKGGETVSSGSRPIEGVGTQVP